LTSRKEAIRALHASGCSKEVIQHCLTVERIALQLAKQILSRGHELDLNLVRIGALLHDIGRSRTHGITHGVEGGKILRRLGLRKWTNFAENHIGAGIPKNEAVRLGLPARNFMPRTLEEKIVTYADKLAEGNKKVSYRRALESLKSDLGEKHPAVRRFRRLHEEIRKLSNGGPAETRTRDLHLSS